MGGFASGPSLALRQRRRRAGFDLSNGTLPAGATLSRASAGARTGADGVIVFEAANVARFDHDRAGRRLGLLIEPAATNRALRSTAFGDAATWIPALVTTAAAAAPDGSSGATILTDSVSDGYGSISQAVSGTLPLIASLYVAKDAVDSATRFVLIRLSGRNDDLLLDTATGIHASPVSETGVIDAGAFWRAWVRLTEAPGYFQVYPAAGSGGLGNGYSLSAQGSATIWGAQL